jgi:hypothetical protein
MFIAIPKYKFEIQHLFKDCIFDFKEDYENYSKNNYFKRLS